MKESNSLRDRAEKKINTQKMEHRSENADELVNELRIHQAELEMQNEELRQSQQEYAELYNKYLDLYNDMPVGYFTLDKDGIIRNVNEKGADLLQTDKDKIIGRGFSHFIPESEEYKYYTGLANSIDTCKNQELDLQIKRNKTLFEAHMEIMPIFDRSGSTYRVILTDITEHKKVEADLIKAKERYRIVADFTYDWEEWNDKGELKYISPSCERITGYSAQEFIDNSDLIFNIIHPDDLKSYKKHINELFSSKTVESIVFRIISRDGDMHWIERICQPVYNDKGQLMGRRASNRDITENKKAEEALKEVYDVLEIKVDERTNELKLANAYTRSLIEASLDPLVTIGSDGKITDVNIATELTTGYSRDELICSDFCSYFTEPVKAREGYKHVFRDGEVRDYPLEIKHKNGSLTPVLYNASVYRDEDGEIIGIFAAARDIKKLKQSEKTLKDTIIELKRSNMDLEQFAHISSHDLQEPLRTIASFTQLMERRYKGQLDENADEFMDFIVEAAKRMKDQIEGLLEYSRVVSKGEEFEEVDMNKILKHTLNSLNTQIEEADAEIIFDKLPVVVGDELQLQRVFQNLISNAIKFRKQEESLKIHISAYKTKKGKGYVFSVHDNGIGIEKQYLDRIFTIFQQLHTRDVYQGTGIGLSVVKRILERHGGRIWVESEFGVGSTFYFTIPDKPVETRHS